MTSQSNFKCDAHERRGWTKVMSKRDRPQAHSPMIQEKNTNLRIAVVRTKHCRPCFVGNRLSDITVGNSSEGDRISCNRMSMTCNMHNCTKGSVSITPTDAWRQRWRCVTKVEEPNHQQQKRRRHKHYRESVCSTPA